MKATALTRNYDLLTADERLRLALRARARGDAGEMERLRATCPRKMYEMRDADFSDAFVATHTIALVFAQWWRGAVARFLAAHLAVLDCHRTGDAAGTLAAGDAMGAWAAYLAGVWAGYERFCDGARLDARDLLAGWLPNVLEEVDRLLPHLVIVTPAGAVVAAKPDEEGAEEIRDLFAAYWRELRPTMRGDRGD